MAYNILELGLSL